jgi:hypothetical protein
VAFFLRHLRGYTNEFPRRKRRGINRKILIAPRGGVLNLYPPLEGSSAAGGLKIYAPQKTRLCDKLIRGDLDV